MATPCPVCSMVDQIRKVSSIVTSGTSSGSFSGPTGGTVNVDGKTGYSSTYSTLSGSSSTLLAQMVAPPREPSKKGSCFLNGVMIFCIIETIAGLGLGIGFATSTPSVFNEAPIATGIMIGIMGGGTFGLFAWLCFRAIKSHQLWNEQEYPKLLKEWQRQMANYDSLYYCHRDDVVFNPENNKYAPARELSKFLAEN